MEKTRNKVNKRISLNMDTPMKEFKECILVNNPNSIFPKDIWTIILNKLDDGDKYYVTGKWNQIKNVCNYAARRGHLEVLQWARENGCHWDKWTCAYAAKCGHLEILQWARENGCPWDKWTCAYAAFRGHLEVLQWAHKNGCPKMG
jgi:hypothetical protein